MTPRIDTIMRFTAAATGVGMNAILSPRRDAPTVRARWIAMYLAREMTHRSFPAIARSFGDRDHTSVMHACRQIAARIGQYPELAELVESIRTGLQLPAEAA